MPDGEPEQRKNEQQKDRQDYVYLGHNHVRVMVVNVQISRKNSGSIIGDIGMTMTMSSDTEKNGTEHGPRRSRISGSS